MGRTLHKILLIFVEYHERRFLNGLSLFVKEDSMPCWSERNRAPKG